MGKLYFEEDLKEEQIRICRHNKYGQNNYSLLKDCMVFENNGLFGLKGKYGEIVLECVFDQVEIGKEWVYTRTGRDYTIFRPTVTSSYFHDSEDFFVCDGKMGWQKDGKIIVPAIYDDIDKASNHYDIFNVTDNGQTKCINSKNQVILENLGGDGEFEGVYLSSDDQDYLITQCMLEGDDDNVNTVIYKGKEKVKLVSSNCQETAAKLMEGSDGAPITMSSLSLFNNAFSYEYQSYEANTFDKDQPIRQCIKKLEQFGFDYNSWHYIAKVEMHPSVAPSVADLEYFLSYFDNIENLLGMPVMGFVFNPGLKEGETRMRLITFYNEVCFPSDFYWEWGEAVNTLPLSKIKEEIPKLVETIKSDVDPDYQESLWHDMTDNVIISMRPAKERTWAETEKVLDYFKQQGSIYKHGLAGVAKKLSNAESYDFYLNLMKWLVENDAEVNGTIESLTALDIVNNVKSSIEKQLTEKFDPKFFASFLDKKLTAFADMADFLVKHGAKTIQQINNEIADCDDYRAILQCFNQAEENGWAWPE